MNTSMTTAERASVQAEARSSANRSLVQKLIRPEFIWRPNQLFRRLLFKPDKTVKPLRLPWGCTICASSDEIVGRLIATVGLYDLPLTESILRLTVKGDTAIDIGANIGYTALVLARAAGSEGRVICFEPNPLVLPLLRANLDSWTRLNVAPIAIKEIALSDRDGEAVLGFPDDYEHNQGVASLEVTEHGVPVSVRQLDSLDLGNVGIMKVDVEGHEGAVFSGSTKLLARKSVRDVLFEEHDTYPARSHQVLLDSGYHIFRITGSFLGPYLSPPQTPATRPFLPPEYPPNYLATIDPDRAKARFKARGWHALSSRV